jgi:hypothetical protein
LSSSASLFQNLRRLRRTYHLERASGEGVYEPFDVAREGEDVVTVEELGHLRQQAVQPRQDPSVQIREVLRLLFGRPLVYVCVDCEEVVNVE